MNIIERVKNILVSPKKEWDVIAAEEGSVSSVLTTYVLPLSLIGAAATLIGWGLIGKSFDLGFFGSYTVKGWEYGIKYAIISLVSVIVSYFVTTFVVDALAPSFGSEKNINKSAQFVGYSYTPSLVAAVLAIFPSIAWLGSLIGGIYAIYLMYLGLGPVKKTPDDKRVVYLVISIVILMVLTFVIAMILVSLFGLGKAPGTGNLRFN